MRLITLSQAALGALALVSVLASPACSKKDPEAQGIEATDDVGAKDFGPRNAITEQHEAATVSWVVTPDGKVKARLKSPDGKAIGEGVTGTLRVTPPTKDASPVTVPLQYDAASKAYAATIPALEADLTEMRYEAEVDGKPIKGALHLPRGGTKHLISTARMALAAKRTSGKRGPNGGILQVAGDDLLEIVADKNTGQVRAYVLDDNYKPIAVGKRRVKLGVGGATPETVTLAAEPKGLYLTGKLTGRANPSKLTVVLYDEADPEPVVVLCGWDPARVIIVGPSAPALELFVAVNWAPIVVVDPRPQPVIVVGKGKWKHHGRHGGWR